MTRLAEHAISASVGFAIGMAAGIVAAVLLLGVGGRRR